MRHRRIQQLIEMLVRRTADAFDTDRRPPTQCGDATASVSYAQLTRKKLEAKLTKFYTYDRLEEP